MLYDLIVIGGGAAGIFAAVTAKGHCSKVLLLEKTNTLLSKVRVSGGGRCNVTHDCLDPKELIKHYPRGGKELLGPFHHFGPKDTIDWFESRGVKLKIEADGRMFPTTNRSETIIQCLLQEAERLGVEIRLQQRIEKIEKGYTLSLKDGSTLQTKNLLLATGSSKDGYDWATSLGHTIQKPIPSLFTFNVPTSPLLGLSGIAIKECEIELKGTNLRQKGPLLLTHFGFSGPAVIKLSAWAAPYLFEKNYKAELIIHWPEELPKNLQKVNPPNTFLIEGKTTHKEEFVTCGGVTLKEVDFRTMQSKLSPNLYFSGEILNIDGVTGGFNFQNAWTTAYLAGSAEEHSSRIKLFHEQQEI